MDLIMYAFLRDRFGRMTADMVFAVWYTLLIVLVVYYVDAPPGVFRYMNW